MAYLHSRVWESQWGQAEAGCPQRLPRLHWSFPVLLERQTWEGQELSSRGQQGGERGVTSDLGPRSPAPVPEEGQGGFLVASVSSRGCKSKQTL